MNAASPRELLRRSAMRTLGPMERALLAREGGGGAFGPPIFIVGPPRSGTSLVYEMMVTGLRLAYFANLAHRLPETPVAATRLGRALIRRWRGAYASDYGHIDGWGAPNEGGRIWRRWLSDAVPLDEAAAGQVPVDEMRRTVAAMSRAMQAPFLNKNVMHSNRLRLFEAIWPGFLAVEVRRDPLENARSIIMAQSKGGGPAPGPDDWWSVRPRIAAPGSAATAGGVIERACIQVQGVARDIAEDMALLGRGRLLQLDLADVCADPRSAMETLAGFLRGHGLAVVPGRRLPERFSMVPGRTLPAAEDEAELSAAMTRVAAF